MARGPFERLLADLVRSEVRFLVVGGLACLFNGLARSTENIDLLVDAGSRRMSGACCRR